MSNKIQTVSDWLISKPCVEVSFSRYIDGDYEDHLSIKMNTHHGECVDCESDIHCLHVERVIEKFIYGELPNEQKLVNILEEMYTKVL